MILEIPEPIDIAFTKTSWTIDDYPILFMSHPTVEKKKRPKRTPLDETAPQMVTIQELSQLTGMSEYCIRGLCKRNEIKYIRTGTKILINYERFKDYMNR